MIRECSVKGSFYPSDSRKAEAMLKDFFSNPELKKIKAESRVVVAPHAGWIYSGATAAYSCSALKKAKCYIILSPNHTGLGEEISIYPDGSWESLFGNVKVDEKIATQIAEEMDVERDELAHIGEHSIEVQLPFLQYKFGNDFSIVPITIAEHRFEELEKLGKIIGKIMEKYKDVCLIASSDFSHFISEERAKKADLEAIELIKRLDSKGFFGLVERKGLSICGAVGITSAIIAAKELGMKKASLLRYTSSAEETKDRSNVVAYASLSFG